MKNITTIAVFALFTSIAQAVPIEYTFKVTNPDQLYREGVVVETRAEAEASGDPWRSSSNSEGETTVVYREQELLSPIYAAPDITVSFFYDAEAIGRFSSPSGELSSGTVSYVDAISDLRISINGQEHSRENNLTIFADETDVVGTGRVVQDELVNIDGLFGSSSSDLSISLQHEGRDFVSDRSTIVFLEDADGNDFFPDDALADIPVNFGYSSAKLPGELPFFGTDASRFFLTFESASVIGGDDFFPTHTFTLEGQLTAVPIPAAAWLFASSLGLLGWMRRK